MARIGFVCYSSDGHLHPSLTLATELRLRGHEVVFYTLADGAKKVEKYGFTVRCYGQRSFPAEQIEAAYRAVGQASGMRAINLTIKNICLRTQVGLSELPDLIRADQVDGLLVDQVVPDAAAVARSLGLPFVTVCNAFPTNPDPGIPPLYTHFLFRPNYLARLRNQLFNHLMLHMAHPVLKIVNQYQQENNLPIYKNILAIGSDYAQVTQIPAVFDFPRSQPEPTLHYTAPFHNSESRLDVDFPWDSLQDNVPLVYASMGTIQNQVKFIYPAIADACSEMNVQLVLSLGGGSEVDEFKNLAGNPILVKYAPQLRLLKRASVCFTHAGLNTTLEAISAGVPLVAVPVTNDQPGVAARIQWHGIGVRLKLGSLTSAKIRSAIQQVLSEGRYAETARSMRDTVAALNGPLKAALIAERVIETGAPVTVADIQALDAVAKASN